jgi:uncharacterized Zn finger protein
LGRLTGRPNSAFFYLSALTVFSRIGIGLHLVYAKGLCYLGEWTGYSLGADETNPITEWSNGMYWDWKPYVSVAQRRKNAEKFAKQQAKKLGRSLQPIAIQGNKIAKTFWGKAWCEHLERLSDYASRLPRGRTYVRNGSVIDLHIATGIITAFVSGSEVYEVEICIDKLKAGPWEKVCEECSTSIDSLLDLLQGKLSDGVMKRLTHATEGLFPQPKQIKKSCSCPDGASMCKHVAAVLYGVGSRLDLEPQLLFTLRGVDHLELIAAAATNENLNQSLQGDESNILASDDLSAIFGIEIEGEAKNTANKKPNLKTAARKQAKQKSSMPANGSAKEKTPKKKVKPKLKPKAAMASTKEKVATSKSKAAPAKPMASKSKTAKRKAR